MQGTSAERWSDDVPAPPGPAGEVGRLLDLLRRERTARRAAQARLREVEARLRTLTGDEAADVEVLAGHVDLAALVAEVEREVAPVLAARRLRVEIGPVPALAPLRGRADDLVDVLVHLLRNAVDFTPDGGSVSLTVHPGAEDVELVVADTGIGIPRAEHGRVLERQTLVRGIVEEHGGALEIDSAEGAGTTVTVRLPQGSTPSIRRPSAR